VFGKFISEEGDVYIGELYRRKRHGRGTLTRKADGAALTGLWKDDELVEEEGKEEGAGGEEA